MTVSSDDFDRAAAWTVTPCAPPDPDAHPISECAERGCLVSMSDYLASQRDDTRQDSGTRRQS